ncbi:MAG TPA: zf-HC2 domain-containing protein [Planctomycetota bacterium]|nr:zf-HC2 domain-containing protein [Planctomycetota bacterium]
MKGNKPFCEKISRSFHDYYDGELSLFMKRVVQKHLGACVPCRRDYVLLQMTIESIRQKVAPDVPPRLLKKIIRQFTDPGPGGKPAPRELLGGDWTDGLQRI